MKKLLVTVCMLIAISSYANAQGEANNWYFGHNAAITFNTSPPSFLTGSPLHTDEGCASISDAAGRLLFYSDGATVWDSTHVPMPNGSGLYSGNTSSQAALIIPMPGSSSLYYIFTPPQNAQGFYYSIVDMTLNNGRGDVTVKNSYVFSPSTERVTAASHANGTDVWILGHPYNSYDFRAYLLTDTGFVNTPVITTIGSYHGGSLYNGIGTMKTSPCGGKLAVSVHGISVVEVFDFDNATGVLSNCILLDTFALGNSWGLYGVEFSPDGSKLYVGVEHPAVITQYDMNAGSPAAIIASATVIYSQATLYIGGLQNGPDGRIYAPHVNGHYLAVINYPDSMGTSCNFVDSAVFLGSGIAAHGLPNYFPPLFCGLNVGTDNMDAFAIINSIYPNPASTSATIELGSAAYSSSAISIINALGEIVYRKNVTANATNNKIAIPLTSFSKGVYFVSLYCDNTVSTKKLVIK